MSSSIEYNDVVVHDLTGKLDSRLRYEPMFQDWIKVKAPIYTGGNEKKEGKEMDKTIVSKWRNRKEEKLKKELEENREILRKEDNAYKEIKETIEKWKDELSGAPYEDIVFYSQYCISAETQERIAAIEKEYRDRFDALDRKAAMINAAMEFVSDYDSMKKVLEDFGIWKEIIEG